MAWSDTNVTSIPELKKLFGDFVSGVLPERFVQYVDSGDWPKIANPSVLISTNFQMNGIPKIEFDPRVSDERVLRPSTVTFTVDVIGGDSRADAANIMCLAWSSNSWVNMLTRSGLGEITSPKDLTGIETGAMKSRHQISVSLHCVLTSSSIIDTFNLNNVEINPVDKDEVIVILES